MTTVIGKGGHRIIRWAALLIALTVTAASLLQAANIKPTLADTGGYPWYNAPCAWNGSTTGPCSDYDWGESTCPSGDGYCNSANQINGYYIYDQWGAGFRNCTSYAAWMLSTQNGFTLPFYDNAANWGTRAQNLGYTVNMTPAVGSIYYTTSPAPDGHVAWVQNVSGSSVTIEDYNSDTTGDYSGLYTVSTSSASGYIHFKDLTTPASDFTPITGDFNGDGLGDIGLRKTSTGMFYFKHGTGFTDQSTYNWAPGAGTDFQAFTGDFNGDGYWDIGLRSISTGMFYMKHGTSFTDQFTYQWASG